MTRLESSGPTSTEPAGTRSRGGRLWLRRRLATGSALVVGALLWGTDVAFLRELLLILPLVYAVTVAVGRPRAAWPVLIASSGLLAAANAQPWVSVDAVIIGAAAVGLLAGTALGRSRGLLVLQGLGVLVFAGLAVLAADTAPDWARWLVATGWAAHALWDVAHLRARRAVVSSYAEWCAVLDLCVAVMLVTHGT